jgi:hypothetical protein
MGCSGLNCGFLARDRMVQRYRKPSDPSSDITQMDRIAVCAPYNLEFEWNPQKLEFVSLWPEPDSCSL